MQQSGPTNFHAWIPPTPARPDARIRLFCFPYAGAGAAAYRGWAGVAPATLDIRPIQLPGRENRLREAAVSSMAELVGSIADAILPWSDKPFAFFGHSLGALISFETARELRRRGQPLPVTLFVSACRAPQLAWPHPPVRHLGNIELLTEVNRRYNGSVPDVILNDAELRELLTPALRADMTLVETYQYSQETPLSCPLIAFGGDADPMVAANALAQWRDQTSDSFVQHMVPGDHLFLQSARSSLLMKIERAICDEPTAAVAASILR